jgi:hypothetical protein
MHRLRERIKCHSLSGTHIGQEIETLPVFSERLDLDHPVPA